VSGIPGPEALQVSRLEATSTARARQVELK